MQLFLGVKGCGQMAFIYLLRTLGTMNTNEKDTVLEELVI